MRLVRGHPMLSFVVLAYAVSWSLVPFGSFLPCGPLVAALDRDPDRPGARRTADARSTARSMAGGLDVVAVGTRTATGDAGAGGRPEHGPRRLRTLMGPVQLLVRRAARGRSPTREPPRRADGRGARLPRLRPASPATQVHTAPRDLAGGSGRDGVAPAPARPGRHDPGGPGLHGRGDVLVRLAVQRQRWQRPHHAGRAHGPRRRRARRPLGSWSGRRPAPLPLRGSRRSVGLPAGRAGPAALARGAARRPTRSGQADRAVPSARTTR